MSSDLKQRPRNGSPAPLPASERGRLLDPVSLLTLVGVVALLMIAFSNMRDIDRLDRTLGERLGKLETQVAQIAERPAQAPQQQQRGPDPNRVYAINTASAPSLGRSGAPVTIAEFSDFQ